MNGQNSHQADLVTKDDLEQAIELLRLSTKHDNEVLRRDLTIRMLLIVGASVGTSTVAIIGALFAMLQALGVSG